MKIKTQFILSTAIFTGLLLVFAVSLFNTNDRIRLTNEREAISRNIEQEANELSFLSHGYVLYQESHLLARWESRFAAINDDITQLSVDSPEQQAVIDNLRANRERLVSVFNDIKSAVQTPGAVTGIDFIRVSWSRMEVQNQGLISDAARLTHLLIDQRDALRQKQNLLITSMLGAFGLFLLANYMLTSRRIIDSLATLQAGTNVIGSGNLDYAIPETGRDEIGDLSRAFNRMTASLKSVTASKSDLEREIEERKKAEEQIKSLARFPAENPNPIMRFTKGIKLLYANDPGHAMLERLGDNTGDFVSQDFYRNLADIVASDRMTEAEITIKDRHFLFLFMPIASEDYVNVYGRDITEQKRAEEALKESEHNYRSLFEGIQESFVHQAIITDEAGKPVDLRFVEVNPVAEKNLGKTQSELVGRKRSEIQGPLDAQALEIIASVMKGESVHRERRVTADERWLDVLSYSPRPGHIASLSLDVTDRKLAEEALRESERKYRSIIELANEGVWVTDGDRKTTSANQRIADMLGYTIEELMGRIPTEFLAKDQEQITLATREKLESGAKTQREFKFRRKDGSALWVISNASPVLGAEGRLRGTVSMLTDITDRKRMEEQLREQLYMLEQAPVAVRNLDDKIIFWNRGMEKMFGFTLEEAYGKTFSELLRTEFPEPLEEIKHKVYYEGSWEGEFVSTDKTGNKINIASYWSLYRDAQNNPAALVEVNTDITALKDAEERAGINQRLADIGQLTGTIAHEIRNPLATIGSSVFYLDMRLKESDEKVKQHLARIKYSVDLATGIIEGIRSQTRLRKPELVSLDLREVLKEAVFVSNAPENVRVETAFPEGKVTVPADRNQLLVAFPNLLRNSIEAMPQGGNLRIGLTTSDSRAELTIADTGAGIAPENLAKVFKLLFTTKMRGTGFGLPITRRIIEAHGGTIGIESQVGAGTTVTISLPLRGE